MRLSALLAGLLATHAVAYLDLDFAGYGIYNGGYGANFTSITGTLIVPPKITKTPKNFANFDDLIFVALADVISALQIGVAVGVNRNGQPDYIPFIGFGNGNIQHYYNLPVSPGDELICSCTLKSASNGDCWFVNESQGKYLILNDLQIQAGWSMPGGVAQRAEALVQVDKSQGVGVANFGTVEWKNIYVGGKNQYFEVKANTNIQLQIVDIQYQCKTITHTTIPGPGQVKSVWTL